MHPKYTLWDHPAEGVHLTPHLALEKMSRRWECYYGAFVKVTNDIRCGKASVFADVDWTKVTQMRQPKWKEETPQHQKSTRKKSDGLPNVYYCLNLPNTINHE
jgi:hypothetical protein